MKRTAAGILIGAVVYFGWGMISWMVLPWHNTTLKKLPEEQLIMDTLKTVIAEPGFYVFPNCKGPDGQMMDKNVSAEKFKKGPNGAVIFSPGGREPMPPQAFIIEILANLLIAAISMVLLRLTRDRVTSIVPRALMIAFVGLLVGAAAHVPYWNWFQFPADFTRVAVLDSVIGFFLLGFAQAKFVPEN